MILGKKGSQAIRLTKSEIRSKILVRLKTQKEEERKTRSRVIKNKLFKTRVFKKAKTVMFYMSIGGEVNTKEMIQEAIKLGKKAVVPVCRKYRMMRACFLGYKEELVRGPYGIGEPAVKKNVRLKDLDLVLVPGVAFTKKGARLGRGKGYYDRFLNRLPKKVTSVGLAFSFQILPSLPTGRGDVSVSRVIFA
ncbi:MAG: 5-formyltetrahydrofolate cyclo-ligase [Candidatus Omnitrophota bacterium]|nr:5-formyltetrahydrofolate cyclo-ligase [Candidatus Omnitrophota bacterium]